MTVKEFLQGKWLGHPLHPALVHAPVGLWLGALLFDLLSLAGWGGAIFPRIAFYAIAIGLAAAVISIPPGLADWMGIKREKPAWKLGVAHMLVNLVAAGIWGWNLWVRWPEFQEGASPAPLAVLLSVLGTLLLLVGAWLGKRMVFDQGTSVARLSKGELRERAEKGRAALPDK